MSIVEGIEKYIPYITTKDKKHQQVSYQTQSNTVIMNDGGLTLDENMVQINNDITSIDNDITSINNDIKTISTDITAIKGIVIVGVLEAGQTELIFENKAITTNSTFDYYTDLYGISAKDVSVENGKLTMTFKVLENNLNVKVVIR